MRRMYLKDIGETRGAEVDVMVGGIFGLDFLLACVMLILERSWYHVAN